jgi:hypothetical protein
VPDQTKGDIPSRERYTDRMRNRPPFTCRACGTASQKQQSCSHCGGQVVDADGLAPLASVHVRANTLGVVSSMRTWFADRMSRQRVEQRCAGAGPLKAIADAPDGTVRIRGRVRGLRMVQAPDGALVAAFRSRRRLDIRESSPPHPSPKGPPMRRWIEERSGCGAFLVDDGSGVALVDDDAFDIEALDVAPLPAGADGMLALREGDLVEVVGSATRGPPPPELADEPRVGSGPLLRFDGRPDRRLLLLPLPLTAMMPTPQSKWFKSSSRPGGPKTQEHESLSELEAASRGEAEARGRTTRGG